MNFHFRNLLTSNIDTGQERRKKRKSVEKSPTKADIMKQLQSLNIKVELINMKLNEIQSSKRATNQGGSYCVVM